MTGQQMVRDGPVAGHISPIDQKQTFASSFDLEFLRFHSAQPVCRRVRNRAPDQAEVTGPSERKKTDLSTSTHADLDGFCYEEQGAQERCTRLGGNTDDAAVAAGQVSRLRLA